MNFNDFVKTEGGIFAPAEFYASGITCGLTDIGLLYSKTPCDVCAIFTDNKFSLIMVMLILVLLMALKMQKL